LHRIALALPDGEPDEALARNMSFATAFSEGPGSSEWPRPDPQRWQTLLREALETELKGELETIRRRQESYLQRELDRIDEYFDHYERELSSRAERRSQAKEKTNERLAAAKVEHARRRADQVSRHEIRVQPRVDALLMVGERGWRAAMHVESARSRQDCEAVFVPRARRWFAV
jgi:hypothetical protein